MAFSVIVSPEMLSTQWALMLDVGILCGSKLYFTSLNTLFHIKFS